MRHFRQDLSSGLFSAGYVFDMAEQEPEHGMCLIDEPPVANAPNVSVTYEDGIPVNYPKGFGVMGVMGFAFAAVGFLAWIVLSV